MGFMRVMARIGLPGGTARTIALQYHSYIQEQNNGNPIQNNEELIALLTTINAERYAIFPSRISGTIQQMILDGSIRSLKAYVKAVLFFEENLLYRSSRYMVLEVVEEELLRAGVPMNLIIGANPNES